MTTSRIRPRRSSATTADSPSLSQVLHVPTDSRRRPGWWTRSSKPLARQIIASDTRSETRHARDLETRCLAKRGRPVLGSAHVRRPTQEDGEVAEGEEG